MLDQIAETGYTGLELGPWGYLPTDPDLLRDELDQRNLRLLSSFVPVNFARRERPRRQAKRRRCKSGGCWRRSARSASCWRTTTAQSRNWCSRPGGGMAVSSRAISGMCTRRGVNRVARAVYDQVGLKVVFHHHCAGYVETAEEVRSLMNRADPDLVGLCLDTGHWHYAGGDAVKAVKEYGERVRYLHLKDCDPSIRELAIDERMDYFAAVAAGVFCELGQGAVDFPALIGDVDARGYEGWAIVEQDILVDDPEAPRQSARRNREYLRTLGL